MRCENGPEMTRTISESRIRQNLQSPRSELGLPVPVAALPNTSRSTFEATAADAIAATLEEKQLPYKATYVEEGPGKPDWFMQNNPSGLMPVLRDGQMWIQDSDKISEHLEKKFPEPSLKTPEKLKSVGAGIFPAFTNWLKAMDRSAPAGKEFVDELTALDEHLKQHGPYIAGKEPTDSDFALIPKLRHARVALKRFMDFEFPKNLGAVAKYIELMESRTSFKKTDSPDEMIMAGWQKKFDLPDKVEKNSAHEKRTAVNL